MVTMCGYKPRRFILTIMILSPQHTGTHQSLLSWGKAAQNSWANASVQINLHRRFLAKDCTTSYLLKGALWKQEEVPRLTV
jgi:hypothetical protein